MTATLKLSNDRKVSPLSRWEPAARRWAPKVPNAFGLPAGKSCPGMTSICEKVCYAKRTEGAFPSAGRLVEHNWSLLQALGDDVDAMVELLSEAVARFEVLAEKHNTAKLFRIHWDGDFYSRPYAEAWAEVCRRHSEVSFWAYTRTLDVVDVLSGIRNLRLLVSTDADNYEAAKLTLRMNPGVFAAVLDDTAAEGQLTMQDLIGRKAPVCPENVKKVPLVNDQGVGACASCLLCTPKGPQRGNVIFSIAKR